MATSTSTLLQVVNRVLINANERTVVDTTTLVGQQVKEAIRMATILLFGSSHWIFTQSKVNASSWSSGRATLPTTTVQIRSVAWDNGDSILLPVPYLRPDEFDRYDATQSYSDNTGRPAYYTIRDYNLVDVFPYPTTVGERAKIWFYTKAFVDLPSSDSSTFSVPEYAINMVVLKATELYMKRGESDYMMNAAYEMQKVMASQITMPHTAWNMYRRDRVEYGQLW